MPTAARPDEPAPAPLTNGATVRPDMGATAWFNVRAAARLKVRTVARFDLGAVRRLRRGPSSSGDRWALGAVVALVGAAVLAGALLGWAGRPVHAPAAPLFGHVIPHVGLGTPAAVALALAVIRWGPGLAERLTWRRMLAVTWAASVAWTFALALVDGWQRGLAGRLTTEYEYLAEVPGVTDTGAMLRGFADRIVEGGPDPWTTHVAGHPPGALLVFVGLDRLGLSGGGWAAVVCILAGSLATVAIAITLRTLGEERAARIAAPFLVLFPGAVWMGASADGLFAGAAAGAFALFAVGLSRPSRVASVAGGAGLAACVYLSYGLVLLALPAAALIALNHRRRIRTASGPTIASGPSGRTITSAPSGRTIASARSDLGRSIVWPVLGAAVGAVAVVAVMTLLGFRWWEGYDLVRVRYYQGLASARPYAYWVWANLAALALCAGPATAAILRRAAVRIPRSPVAALAVAWAAAALAADLSGLSKAEVERIWLPFAVWLPAAAALLPRPDRRFWLVAQAGTALLVNHLVLTAW
ncbi:hypothetical protein [Paractinoplanes hotanensis]|uniref:Integral membrane protein n=1 Tax=Paractinoplanes hotanensis TaxID=2906497 RepID=A0ABT0XVR8_9ACTN|nr:hypothetical protein [Actinoplanes hotanensis]MCM4077888.1 hypothetical protein [Actinoplanes hotanensis]